MKKFFGILLAAVSALVLLPGCGGGDSDPTKMTAKEFARGSKYFIFQNGLAGWLYVVPDKQFPGYEVETKDVEAEGMSGETAPAVVGTINVGGKGGPIGGFEYTCYYDEEGIPVTADLTITSQTSAEGNTALINFFNEAQGDDGEQVTDLRGTPVIHIDFRSNNFTIKANVQADNDPDDEVIEFGGSVVVQHQ